MRSSAKESLQKIKVSLSSAGKNVQSTVDEISNYLDTEKGSSQVTAVSSSLETIAGAIPSLTSNDPLNIVSGSLTVISSVASLIPVAGQIISAVFSVIGTIFGAIAGSASEDIGTVVRREIENALNKYDDSQLRAEASGAIRVYAISHAYLATKEGGAPIQEHELAALSANVPVYQGIGFLGMLAQKVIENSKSSSPDQVKRAMEYLQLYVTLAVLRSSLLWEMIALVRTAPDSAFTADAIHRVVNQEDKNDEQFLKFLLEPDYSQAVFFAYFNPSEWPQIMTFMDKKGLTYQRHVVDKLARGTHSFKPERWTNYYMYMVNNGSGNMEGWKLTPTFDDPQGQFIVDPISRQDNLFHLRSMKWPSWYVFMVDTSASYCRGWNDKPGPQGEWKIVKFQDGKYMLSPRKWPNWFIYMRDKGNGSIAGWKGDPEIQGHWIID